MTQAIKTSSLEMKTLHPVQSSKQNADSGKECCKTLCKTLCRVAAVVAIVTLAVLSIIATAMLVPSAVGAVFISLAILGIASEGLRQTARAGLRDVIFVSNQPSSVPSLNNRNVVQI